jgi:hypothetical protein
MLVPGGGPAPYAGEVRSLQVGGIMAHTSTPADWTTETAYWRDNYKTRPYAHAGRNYDYYEPAYRYGFESADRYHGRSWDDVQDDLQRGWENYKLRGQLAWNEIKDAVRDSWDRATSRMKTSH